MVNQNAENEVYHDFKYWEDRSDEFRDGAFVVKFVDYKVVFQIINANLMHITSISMVYSL